MINRENYRDYKKTKREQSARYRERTGSNKYPRRSFTEKEDLMIMESDECDRVIAEKIGRSVSSIQHRRMRLRKKAESSDNFIMY